VSFQGTISMIAGKCPTISFHAAAYNVTTDSSTAYGKGACSSLNNGKTVSVQGLIQPNGSVGATSITPLK